MMRLATFFAASAAVVSAKAVEEDAEVDFEELFEGRFLAGNGSDNSTTTTTVAPTTTTTSAPTSDTTTTTGMDHSGHSAATDKVITVTLAATVALTHPVADFTDDNFITQLNTAAADRTDDTSHYFAKGCWAAYYALAFPDTTTACDPTASPPAGCLDTAATQAQKDASTATFSFTAASSRRRLATIGTGKTLGMEFATSGLTAMQANGINSLFEGDDAIDAGAAQLALSSLITASFAEGTAAGKTMGTVTSMTVASIGAAVTTAPTTTAATTTAASSAAGLGLPIVAALFSAVLMF